MFGGITFAGAAFAGLLGIQGALPPPDTSTAITIGGIDVKGRVRRAGLTIRDVLNDAPSTCTFTIEGTGPAVGQRVQITLGTRLLFGGVVQTIDQSYESKPDLVAWQVTAIDDTALANARRPFGTFVNLSATTVAQQIVTTFAPGFATSGIVADLPPVSIAFDGTETVIACLVRLATAISGYCKIDDHTVFLFVTDPAGPPAPITPGHRFLGNPPIQMNTDASQLRTRVYGKGYGEKVTSDIAPDETLLPITNGVMFPPLGSAGIAALTADGATTQPIAFTGVVLQTGGSLVGPGASPGEPLPVALVSGSGVTSGDHTLSVAYRTAAGVSVASPPAAIRVGVMAAPATAAVAEKAEEGTGPDAGTHDYVVSYVTAFGETVPGPISNTVTTSNATGQVLAPGPPQPHWPALEGKGMDDGYHAWRATFVNANGETEGGLSTSYYGPVQSQITGKTDPVTPNGANGDINASAGGNLTPDLYYRYGQTFTTASGESMIGGNLLCRTTPGFQSATVPLATSPDPRVTGRKLYREVFASGNWHQCGTIANNTATVFLDTQADTAIAGNPSYPTVDTTANPGTLTPFNKVQINGIPTGPAGTTARKLYRAFNHSDAYYLIATIPDNTTTGYLDARPNNFDADPVPTSNTSGIAVQRVPLSKIPRGPESVTARKLYRRFNGTGPFKLVKTITNNSSTTNTDSVRNADLGANALTTGTAIGNRILVTLPIGPAAVTLRELYMSAVTGPRRLIAYINDNTTTAYTVTTPDSAITGATEPIADSSGLQQPSGQVNPGSSVLPVANGAPFRPTGGWVILGGGQVVRYAGIQGNTLTGVPTAGAGSITTTVLYGQQAIPSPMLTGVTGLSTHIPGSKDALLKGGAVHVWVQRDDMQAQAEHAARTGGDGVVEFVIVDTSLPLDALAARCEADLARFARPLVTVAYATRDLDTKSGKTVMVDLPPPLGIVQTLTIQEVTITEIDIAPHLLPRFTVKASSVRFSLEDTVRRLIAGGQTKAKA
jgi:hypothetical protein